MRFLFTSLFSNDLGLPTSTLPIAVELRARGHEVAVCNPAQAPSALIAEAGLPNLPIRQLRPKVYAPSTPEVWNSDHFAALTGMLDAQYVHGSTDLLCEVIGRFQPDVVVDSWNPCACLAARVSGRRLATVIHSYVHPASRGFIWWRPAPDDLPDAAGPVNQVLEQHGLAPVRRLAELYVGDQTLIHGASATDPLPPEAPGQHIGAVLWQRPAPTLPPEILQLDDQRPVVWIYTGNPRYGAFPSWADSAVVLRACVEALADCPVQVVVTTGFHPLPKDLQHLPPHFVHLAYVPALEMARRSALLIHHGGYNSCQLSLLVGTPSLVIPTFSEREGNARRLAALSAGEFLVPLVDQDSRKQLDPAALRDLALTMLAGGHHREGARRAGEHLRAYGGARRAADLLEG